MIDGQIATALQAIDKDHPRPWRVEEDWTAEIVDANGKIIMKVEYPRGLWLAQLIVNAVNAYAAYDEIVKYA